MDVAMKEAKKKGAVALAAIMSLNNKKKQSFKRLPRSNGDF